MGLLRSDPNFRRASHSPTEASACNKQRQYLSINKKYHQEHLSTNVFNSNVDNNNNNKRDCQRDCQQQQQPHRTASYRTVPDRTAP